MTLAEAWAELESDCDASASVRYLASVIQDEAVKVEWERCAGIADRGELSARDHDRAGNPLDPRFVAAEIAEGIREGE